MNFANWKTTLAGSSAILMAGAKLLSDLSSGDLNAAFTDGGIILAGIVGLLAKDSNVTGGTIPATKEAEKRV